ncbi:PQQ-binding-like beta-propeller repeat protein [Halorubellus sp. PRR65]|uniref:outer membrane protein assembly factor BamB family protein n=2 Tax=Halobacteriales TaxID=2235 RepID=UPI002B25B2C6|nr:PQQ-binding-like beta-propeller repeat protein [Halorubellus sp. PRR65]
MTRDDHPTRPTRRDLLRRAAGASALAATVATAGCAGLVSDDGGPNATADCSDATPAVDPASGWRVANADPAGTGVAPADAAPDAPTLDWRFPIDGYVGTTRPVVDADRVYTHDLDAHVYAVDRDTGDAVWTRDDVADPLGSPAVADDVLVVTTRTATLGLDPATGDTRWRTAHADPELFAGRPVVHDDVAYVPAGLSLLALDVDDGGERWQHTTGLETTTTPAVTDDAVYYGDADTNLYALDPETGGVDWRYKTESHFAANVVATPDRVYGATENDRVRGLDHRGVQRFATQFDASIAHLAADGARVYVATDDHLTALQRDTGSACWRTDAYAVSYDSGLAVVDNAVYAPIETTAGVALGIYDAATGNRRRTVDPGTDDAPVAVEMGPIVADGSVYVTGNADGLALTSLS